MAAVFIIFSQHVVKIAKRYKIGKERAKNKWMPFKLKLLKNKNNLKISEEDYSILKLILIDNAKK